MSDEIVTLLKKGFVPYTAPEESLQPGYRLILTKPGEVTQEIYLQHMQGAFANLPDSLKGLLSFEAFVAQAEPKRAAIEESIKRQSVAASEQAQGRPDDWLWLTFYSQPESALSWSVSGFDKVWLGVDDRYWQGIEIQPLSYQGSWPSAYPQRLMCDAADKEVLAQGRSLIPREQAGPPVKVGNHLYWLVRVPPKAIRRILIGSAVPDDLRIRLRDFLRQDFRYQRIPVDTMVPTGQGAGWTFQTGLLTSSEKA